MGRHGNHSEAKAAGSSRREWAQEGTGRERPLHWKAER